MSRFNLIDEKWIPVRFPDGSRGELGIQDVLLRAKDIAAIEDPSPLVVAALHRFLLAVLYRALAGPTDIDQAKTLFKSGFPNDKITAYLDKWRDRFWLFDETYPFGQNPNVPKKEIEPWTKLAPEYNATSNKVLFDHTDTRNPGFRQPKECARWLIATMNFSLSGGRGYYPSPSPNAVMCIPLGRNLQSTLCCNLVPYPNREVMRTDTALWERDPQKLPLEHPKRTVVGYADLFTWQARMIRLEERSPLGIEQIGFVAGLGFERTEQDADPMQPHKVNKERGRLPVQFREDRGAWRDFDSLLPDAEGHAPLTIQHALRLAGRETDLLPKAMLVLGLRYTPPNANVDFWRMEQFAIPECLATKQGMRSEVAALLTHAEETQKALWLACRSYARDLLSQGERDPDKSDIANFIKQMPLHASYWSTLESRFHESLGDYTIGHDSDDILCQWLKSVKDALRMAWEQHRASASMGDAWAIRAVVKAEGPIRAKLKELDEEIRKFTPAMEEA